MPTYFRISHDDKDAAKALGARWAPDVELWYAPTEAVTQVLAQRWPRTEPLPPIDTFPGEDRSFGAVPRLALDLIPSTCWFTNVRSCVTRDDWKRIAMGVKHRAGKVCELCGTKPDPAQKLYLDAHERFEYVEGVQRLVRLVCACTKCHLALHYGHARATGREDEAREWLAHVNGWDKAAVDAAVDAAFAVWAQRSRQEWTLDLSIIERAGVVVKLPTQTQRLQKGIHLDTVRPDGMDSDAFMRALGLA